MTLPGSWNKPAGLNFRPRAGTLVKYPNIVKPLSAVRSSKQIELVVVAHNGVVCSSRGDLAFGRSAFVAVLNQDFPLV